MFIELTGEYNDCVTVNTDAIASIKSHIIIPDSDLLKPVTGLSRVSLVNKEVLIINMPYWELLEFIRSKIPGPRPEVPLDYSL